MIAIFLIISIIILDFILYRGVKRMFHESRQKFIKLAFIIQAAIALAIVAFAVFQRFISDFRIIAYTYYFFGGIVAIYAPKGVFALFLIFDRKNKMTKFGICASGFFTLLVVWGIIFGRYDFTVEHVEVTSDLLPPSFDGYTIVQLSDIHAGSFHRASHRFQKVVELVNAQNPDLIVMTGDIVNNFADELLPFIPIFAQMNATDGKFAVLGNHDYGGYYRWKSLSDSIINHINIKNNIELMGFVFLDNRSIAITRSADEQIALVGVENWGILKRFPKRADVQKALEPVRHIPFKIIITHDPSLWTEEIKTNTDVALTITGHTHGMQMGIRLGSKRYSPAPLLPRFRQYWGGLYKRDEQYLYINRGLGVIGFPFRIGMPPEITVITLQKVSN